MMLEMYLNGQLIEVTTPIPALLRNKQSNYLKSLITALEKKHTCLLSKSASKPCYLLSGVQSCINGFVPLLHPGASLLSAYATETTVHLPEQTSLAPVGKKNELYGQGTIENRPRNQTKKVA